jgi:hypothetical protein
MALNNARSKALEPGWLVRFYTSLSHYDTFSVGGGSVRGHFKKS